MHPILVDFGWRELPILGRTHLYLGTYGLLFAAAALAGWLAWIRQARRDGLDLERLLDVGFYALLAGLLGSKIGLILTDPGYYLTNISAFASTLRAAGVLLFGVIAAIVTIALYTRRHNLPFWAVVDSMAPSLALGQSIGRLGCLAAGCCYGKTAPGLSWGIRFTDPVTAFLSGTPLYSDPPRELVSDVFNNAKVLALPENVLHPTQLYQAGADFLLFLVLLLAARRRTFTGQTALLFIGLYSLSRGAIEFFRGDLERGVFNILGTGLQLSTSQLIAIASLIFVAVAWPLLSSRRS